MSFTCRNMSFTCRNMSFTCRNMSFTCRNMSFTCRNMSFTCSSSLVFYVVLFWFVCLCGQCLRVCLDCPFLIASTVCAIIYNYHTAVSTAIHWEPMQIKNNHKQYLTFDRSIFNKMLFLSYDFRIIRHFANQLIFWCCHVVGHFISDHVCSRLVILVISCSVLGRGKKIYIILQVGIN